MEQMRNRSFKKLVYNFKGHTNFALFSLCFPGQSGEQINVNITSLLRKHALVCRR